MTLDAVTRRGFDALFEPRGVIVTGASSHPGKFGAVVLHNVLAHGYAGPVFATNPEAAARGERLFGVTPSASVDDVPAGAAELAILCTPVGVNVDVLRACAAKGVRAAFVITAGYRETGAAGRAAEDELVRAGAELGVLVAGPNGQGLVSTPSALCAQMAAPFPPSGTIGIASQSGNLVSVLGNLAVHSGVGVSRAVSAGNAAAVGIADYLDYFAEDDATTVGIAYVEGVDDLPALQERLGIVTEHLPVVLLKGGRTESGSRAAAAHTGSVATDDRAFAAMCREAGVTFVASVEEAFEAAAMFATQPLPTGPNTVLLTNAGGWGVLAADAIAQSELTLLDLPDDLRDAIDAKLPPRWSRANPIDLTAGETRDTIPELLELVASHPAVDAVVYVGLGTQSNTARVLRRGPFATDEGIERIASFHERQDRRYAEVAFDIAASTGTPVLCATELAVSNPENAGIQALRDRGQYVWWSALRAVRSLEHAWRYASRDSVWRSRRNDMTPMRRVIAAMLAVTAVVAVVFAFTGDPSASGEPPAAPGATPMWSARRVPQPFVDAVGSQHLQRALDTQVGGPGMCVMVEDDGVPVAATNIDTPLIPASAQKLLVAAAALEVLGPDFTYETKVLAPAAAEDGTVDQLVLVGSGDPVIASSDFVASLDSQPRRKNGVVTSLEVLAASIANAGIRHVPHGVVGDDSRYDQQRTVAGWSPSYLADGDVGPIDALTVNDGYQSFNPRRPAADPALNAAAKLTELLVANGVQVGAPSHGVAPPGAVEIAKVTSPSMRDIVGSMLTTSDALTAEMLAKELGVRAASQGTTAAGTAAIVASLQKLGVPIDGLTLMDASGLHRGNRTTCRTLMAALQLGSQPRYDALWNGLSVVGEKGTLVDQLLGLNPPVEGKLSGKTGFLSGVSSLVGKIDDDTRHFQFAFVDNGDYSQTVAETLRRHAVEVLDTFPAAPPADQLVPQPA